MSVSDLDGLWKLISGNGVMSLLVRPVSDLVKPLFITVGVGAVSFTIAYLVDWQPKQVLRQHFLQRAANFFRSNTQKSDEICFTDGEKCAAVLIASNAVVYLLWCDKGLQPMMWRYFTLSHSYASESIFRPMLLSAFSHFSFNHLARNMLVLWPFSRDAVDKFLGPVRFGAFYLTAAAVSSFTSLAYQAVVKSPNQSLGASGTNMALLAFTACKVSDASLKIVFLPFDVSAQNAMIGMVLFDLAGLAGLIPSQMLGGQIDHAGHLGGALFGIACAYLDERFYWGYWRNHNQEKKRVPTFGGAGQATG